MDLRVKPAKYSRSEQARASVLQNACVALRWNVVLVCGGSAFVHLS